MDAMMKRNHSFNDTVKRKCGLQNYEVNYWKYE